MQASVSARKACQHENDVHPRLYVPVKVVVQVEVLGGESAGVAMTLLIGCSVGECKLEKGLKA